MIDFVIIKIIKLTIRSKLAIILDCVSKLDTLEILNINYKFSQYRF